MSDFTNKIVLVSGGGSNIGAEVARQLVSGGDGGYLGGGRDTEKLQQTSPILESSAGVEGQVIPLRADITNEDLVSALFHNIRDRWGVWT